MAIDSTARQAWNIYSDDVEKKGLHQDKAGPETHEAVSSMKDSQQLLLEAQRNAMNAKETALGAISQFYQKSQVSEKKAEKMVRELDEAIQHALDATKKSRGKIAEADARAGQYEDMPEDKLSKKEKKARLSKKVLNNGPLGSFSDLTRSLFGKEAFDSETRAEFYQFVMRRSPQLRQLIDELTEDKAKIRAEKIMNEAKSEIIAARVAVNHSQDEINDIKEKARRAIVEAESTKRAADLLVNQVKQSTIGQVADEIAKAREEVKAVKQAAEIAVQKAEEEVARMRREADTANKQAEVTIALAQDKLKKDTEQAKNAKLQAKITIKQAEDEAKKIKEEAEVLRRQGQESLDRAAMESKQAKQEMESARKMIKEATIAAEKQAYEHFCDEIKAIRDETEVTNKMAYDAITRARQESLQAKEELEMAKRGGERALRQSQEETDRAREAAEAAKQAIDDAVRDAREEAMRAKADAEAAMLQASETMLKAKQDIINLTRSEISRTRQELEAAGEYTEKAPEKSVTKNRKADERADSPGNIDSTRIATTIHEMRAPLHSISGFARLMLEDNVSDNKTRREFLTLMVQQSESLNRLINEMSGMLKSDTAPFSLNKEYVSSPQMISEAVNSVQAIAEQKKNLISRDVSPYLPEIEVDVLRIKQVIVNLLTNAIKFSPERSPVSITAEVREKELLVQVIDHGCGIPEEELSRVFEKYYRAVNCPDVPGTGLGLYICRQTIQAHGGRIWAESVEGKGSTFSFTLPLSMEKDDRIER